MYYNRQNSDGYYVQKDHSIGVILSNDRLPTDYLVWNLKLKWKNFADRAYMDVDQDLVIPKYQYEAALWCEENLEGDWLVGIRNIGFSREVDLIAFKLRWS